jgi:autotransporter-associated beta strand protein
MAVVGVASEVRAAVVTWTGGNYTWVNGDTDSFDATFNSGDSAVFGNAGITNTISGQTVVTTSGSVAPADLSITSKQWSYNSVGQFNYAFGSNGASNTIAATGNLSLGNGASVVFANTSGSGSHITHSFAGNLVYSGSTHIGLGGSNTLRLTRLSFTGNLASPSAGNTVLLTNITVAASTSSSNTNAWDVAGSGAGITVLGTKPAVVNGMISPGIQHTTGGNALGNFMTFSGNDLIPASTTSNDVTTAGATAIVNQSTTATLSSTKSVHALRHTAGTLTINAGVDLNLLSGGLIMSSSTIARSSSAGGRVNFGSQHGFIGVYNAASQATISAGIAGTNGLTIFGTTQTLNLTGDTLNTFTGGLYLNGGTVALSTNGANLNDVTINPHGRLTPRGDSSATTGAIVGGVTGEGRIAGFFQGNGTPRPITISPAPGSYTFAGRINDGDQGNVLSLIKSGAGTQVISATQFYSGTTTVNQGTLTINGGFVAGTTLTGTAALSSTTLSGLTSTAGLVVGQPISGTGILDGTHIARIIDGTSIALSRATSNSVPVSGNQTVGLGSGTGSGNVTVNANGTLAGHGYIAGSVTVSGSISPGTSAGSLEVGSLVLNSSASTVIELGGTSFTLNAVENYDRIKSLGSAALDGTLSVSLINSFTLGSGQLFGIVDILGAASGTFAGLPEGSIVLSNSGYDLRITYAGLVDDASVALAGGSDVVLYTTPIPEPATLGAVAGLAVLGLRRRR